MAKNINIRCNHDKNKTKQFISMERGIFKRTELLLGDKVMNAIQQKRIIVFGVGGVGSWCVECLIRSGIQHMTIVNRQLMATMQTGGEVKVEALKKRLLEINPDAEITALQQVYSAETADSFHIETYDYIVDAIDSLDNKALLIRKACETDAMFVSSMGAALKMDPTKIAVAEFWKVKEQTVPWKEVQVRVQRRAFEKRRYRLCFSGT